MNVYVAKQVMKQLVICQHQEYTPKRKRADVAADNEPAPNTVQQQRKKKKAKEKEKSNNSNNESSQPKAKKSKKKASESIPSVPSVPASIPPPAATSSRRRPVYVEDDDDNLSGGDESDEYNDYDQIEPEWDQDIFDAEEEKKEESIFYS